MGQVEQECSLVTTHLGVAATVPTHHLHTRGQDTVRQHVLPRTNITTVPHHGGVEASLVGITTPQTNIEVEADPGLLAEVHLQSTAKNQRRTERGQFQGQDLAQGRMKENQRSHTRGVATLAHLASHHTKTLARFQGTKGDTAQDRAVMMADVEWRGHALRAMIAMTNTIQVQTS